MAGYECPNCYGGRYVIKLVVDWNTQKTKEIKELCERCGGSGEIQIKQGAEFKWDEGYV